MDFEAAVKLLKTSKLFHSKWYAAQYPDVDMVGLHPAVHYLKYGALLGRDPSRNFSTSFYLATYRDVAKAGMNPLIHYILYGEAEGRLPKKPEATPRGARSHIQKYARRLTTLGFEDMAIADLRTMLESAEDPYVRAFAAKEIALWHMRRKTPDDYRTALGYLERARDCKETPRYYASLAVIEILARMFLGDNEGALRAFDGARALDAVDGDVLLARGNLEETAEGRLTFMNECLALYGTPPLSLLPGEETPYDRLTCTAPLIRQPRDEGPKVTVLIAAYNAADTLPTTLRSLKEQTWQNLEIIVIDDCGSDETPALVEEWAREDDRIRFLRMAKNGGAYVARNSGLDIATGDFVTIHDADDWSHPLKIETQVGHLLAHPEVVGCTSQQARSESSLLFSRWSGGGIFIFTNTSSFMFRRKEMREAVGYWDTVRFAADNEMIRRLQKAYGPNSVAHLPTGPMSFQRDSATSIVAHEFFGINGAPSGVRQEYLEAQLFHHATAPTLRYENDQARRPFPAPASMLPDRERIAAGPRHFDVIIASDFRMVGGSTHSNIQEIQAQKAAGLRTGLFQMYRYDFDPRPERVMLEEVRGTVDGRQVEVLTYGENATCDVLVLRYPPVLQHRQRFLPKIEADRINVIVNQPPMSDYGPEGVVRYRLEDCAENVRAYFGKDAEWYPIGPLVREALLTHHADELPHIRLADRDWHNIIDIKGWNRGERRRGPADRLRIGRHSRDSIHKWPPTREELLQVYPIADDVEVHVLGGADSAVALIGEQPANWIVHPFGALHPREFLADIDIFVYFAHPDWVESFGRTIIEAMAVGVPVILPDMYRPLFRDSALYATPETALDVARRLHADSAAYDAQVAKALKYAADQFSFEMHIDRLMANGVHS